MTRRTVHPLRTAAESRFARRRGSRRGFTLVEVLATLLLVGIVLPTVIQGIDIASHAADVARHTAEAGGLAEAQMAKMLADSSYNGGSTSGDFGTDWPNYRWESSLTNWGDGSTQELDVRVIWVSRNREESVSLATLVRIPPSQ